MKYTDLIPGMWYEGESTVNGDTWIFKFSDTDEGLLWVTTAGVLKDMYRVSGSRGTLSIVDIKPANMKEVYELFPQERHLVREIHYEIY